MFLIRSDILDPQKAETHFNLHVFILFPVNVDHSVARMLAALIMKAIRTASPPDSDCPPVKIRHPIEKWKCRVVTIKQ